MEEKDQRYELDRMYDQLVQSQPWIAFAQKALEAKDWVPPPTEKILIGSDYAGHHPGSRYLTYAFVVSNRYNWAWDKARWEFRQNCIPDNRRISFKRFGKSNNPLALAHFLDTSRFLSGRLFVFGFEKELLQQMPPLRPSEGSIRLDARWKALALEEAVRKAMMIALLASRYVPPKASMDWITDEDPSLGNDMMFADVQRMTATLCGVFSSVQRGIFGMGTTGEDCEHMYREDFVAIADLAAGMVAEVSTHLHGRPFVEPHSSPTKYADFGALSEKTQTIAEWFWRAESQFERTCFLVQGTNERARFMELFA